MFGMFLNYVTLLNEYMEYRNRFKSNLLLAFSDDTEDPVYFAVMDVITDCIQEIGLLICPIIT